MTIDTESRYIMADGQLVGERVFEKKFENISGTINKSLVDGMTRAVLHLERQVVLNLSGKVLKRQTGKLAQSITHAVDHSGTTVTGKVGTSMVYARIHEYGGTVVPKRVRWLTIPIEGAMGKSARNIPRATEIPDLEFHFKGGSGVAGITTAAGQFVPVFRLVKRVRIPKRRPFGKAADKSKKKIGEYLEGAIDVGLKKDGLK